MFDSLSFADFAFIRFFLVLVLGLLNLSDYMVPETLFFHEFIIPKLILML